MIRDRKEDSQADGTKDSRDAGVVSFVAFGLHCVRRPPGDSSIVFVHGILSDGADAWGHPTWPELVAAEADLLNVGIYVFTYRTSVASRTYSISDAADALLEHFALDGLWNQRKIIFVCHSMGGLVVRRFIVANQAQLVRFDPIVGLFLVASPSLGSRDANLLTTLSFVVQHTQAAALRFTQSNTWLNDLHRDFKKLLTDKRLRIKGRELVEDRPIVVKRWLGLRRQVVEPFAAAAYFDDPLKVPGSDHRSIIKPLTRDAVQHRTLARFVKELIDSNDAGNADTPYLEQIMEYETDKAYRALAELHQKAQLVVTKRDALAAVQEALLETRRYVVRMREGGPRDPSFERSLSRLWQEVGSVLVPHDPALANLCFIKGSGWADDRLWKNPRFKDLPVRLNDMLEKVMEALRQNSDAATAELQEALAALKAIDKNLDRFEGLVPGLAALLRQHISTSRHHGVTHRAAKDGYALEFVGYGQNSHITVNDLKKIPPEERRAIAASDEAMAKLEVEWNKIVSKGRLSKRDNERLLDVSSQMGDRLSLIFNVVETLLGGPLQDHYASQRAIAEFARLHYTERSGKPV